MAIQRAGGVPAPTVEISREDDQMESIRYMAVVTFQPDPWATVGVRTYPVELLDQENRLVRYPGGDIIQVASIDSVHQTEADAMMAGAAKMQAEADRLAEAAARARDEAARLAAAGRVTVCST